MSNDPDIVMNAVEDNEATLSSNVASASQQSNTHVGPSTQPGSPTYPGSATGPVGVPFTYPTHEYPYLPSAFPDGIQNPYAYQQQPFLPPQPGFLADHSGLGYPQMQYAPGFSFAAPPIIPAPSDFHPPAAILTGQGANPLISNRQHPDGRPQARENVELLNLHRQRGELLERLQQYEQEMKRLEERDKETRLEVQELQKQSADALKQLEEFKNEKEAQQNESSGIVTQQQDQASANRPEQAEVNSSDRSNGRKARKSTRTKERKKAKFTSSHPTLQAMQVESDDNGNSDHSDSDGASSVGSRNQGSPRSGKLEDRLYHLLQRLLHEDEGNERSTSTSKGRRRTRKKRAQADLAEKEKKEDTRNQARQDYIDLVSDVFEKYLGIVVEEDWLIAEAATKEQIKDFELDDTRGPDPDNLRVDLTGQINSKWNLAVRKILFEAVEKQRSTWDEGKALQERSNVYFENIISDKIYRGRWRWRKAQAQTNSEGETETPAQVEERVVKQDEDWKKRKRVDERRRGRFDRLSIFVKDQIKRRRREGRSDVEIWQWLQTFLNHLGADGLSSDDTDDEGDLRVRHQPWRAAVENYIDYLTKEERSYHAAVGDKRGNKLLKRKRDAKAEMSRRDPPESLPVNLYDANFYKSNKEDLYPGKAKFTYMTIITDAGTLHPPVPKPIGSS